MSVSLGYVVIYSDVEQRKELLRNFIKSNPNTTHKEIIGKLKTKVERVYPGGMAQAFKDAGVNRPRNFKRMTKEEKRKIIIDYVMKNPTAGGQVIKKNTKINISSVFKNIKEVYSSANIHYPREKQRNLQIRSFEDRKNEIISLVKENPLITSNEIMDKTRVHLYRIFKNMGEVYQLAGINLTNNSKRKLKKRLEIIKFIKLNPLATQREINLVCKTHIQLTFDGGIFEAYKQAGIEFPYNRLNIHGSAIKHIRDRAKSFEEEIATKLAGYGTVNRLVKTKRGFADIIFERKGRKTVIEIKDYLAHEISISQIKQLNKYLEDSGCNIGFLVCRKKPSKDRFLIGKNTIYVLTIEELSKIPKVMD